MNTPASLHRPTRAVLSTSLWLLAAVSSLPVLAQQPPPSTRATAAATTEDDWIYALAPGDNPWTVSERFLVDMRLWPKLVAYNRIDNATGMPPGRLLRIPRAWLRLQDARVMLVALQGDVQVVLPKPAAATPPTDATVPARAVAPAAGDLLVPGTVLRTGVQSSVQLRLDDGSTVLLRPDSELVLTSVQRGPGSASAAGAAQTRLELRRGALDNVVAPQGKAGRYEVRTPASVAGVRGTEFRISADEEASRVEVLGGAVAVGNERGEQRLPAGMGTRTRRGEPPEAPTVLPAPPALDALPPTIERLPIVLAVPPAPGSVGQRTQFLGLDGAGTLASDLTSPAGQVHAIDVEDGRYRLRVRSIDTRGLEGPVAERIVQVHARPVPPFVTQPGAGATVIEPRPAFAWTQATEAGRRVRLQLAATDDFAAPWADETLSDAGAWSPAAELRPGRWYWRLQAIDGQRGPGPWGDVQVLVRVPAAPDVPPPTRDARQTTVRWPAVPGASGYEAQLSADASFGTVTLQAAPADPQWSFETPQPGRYVIRVRSLLGTGSAIQPGSWSAPQQWVVDEPPNHWRALWLLMPLVVPLLLAW